MTSANLKNVLNNWGTLPTESKPKVVPSISYKCVLSRYNVSDKFICCLRSDLGCFLSYEARCT